MQIWQIDPACLTPYYDLALCSALSAQGHPVRFVTSNYLYEKLTYPPGVHIDLNYFRLLENPMLLRVPPLRRVLRMLSYPAGHTRLMRNIRRQRPDIVHIQWSRLPLFDSRLAAAIRRLGIPIVHTIHDVDPLFYMGKLVGQITDVYAHVDAFVLHTEENRTRFLQHYPGVDPAKTHIIPLIMPKMDDDTPSGSYDEVQQSARQTLQMNPSAVVVMSFGSVKDYKGLDALIEAIPQVTAQHPEVEFWIVGKPETETDVRVLETLRSLKQVQVRAEYVPSGQIGQYHQAADIMVFPYIRISQSAALSTALTYGRSVIVTDVGGLPDMVNGNGWVIPSRNPAALVSALNEAVSDRARLVQMGARSRELITKNHAPDGVAKQFVELYERLIRSRQTSSI